ncbi:MAG: hypothetical protein JXR75_04680 [Rhodobacteraceae bacterium]|nr:hypothetical protein [Paracoccaceae bacterium]
MTLNYDFDIFDVAEGGEGSGADPFDLDLARLLSRIDGTAATGEKIALFRDPRTADALRRAPQALRDFFQMSGFGLNTYASGAPRGRYPAKDEAARLDIIRRMAHAAQTCALPPLEDYPEGGDGFRLGEFLWELEHAEPMAEEDSMALPDQTSLRAMISPPTLDTQSLAQAQAMSPQPAARKKFWQNRRHLALAMMGIAAAVHLAGNPVILQLTSL